MSVISDLFTEKFRPKDLGTLIAPSRIKNQLAQGLIQNILLYGSAGTGKSSSLFILSKDYTTLYINASSERGIDTLREKIGKFCATISLEGNKEKLKCVILDELDGATTEFFNAFKASMEKYSNVARFIASCNYIQKIPDAIQSRFNCISFDPINNEEEEYIIEEYKKRIAIIFNATKITYTSEILNKFVRNDFPDMRSLLNKVQSFYLQGIKELNDKNFNINYDFEDLYKLCLNKPDKPYENYKFIISEYSSKIDDALNSLSNDFIEYIKTNAPNKLDKIPMIIITTAEHQAQRTLVIDPIITLLSVVYKIQLIVNS
ncbi:AAA family ATPase [bacterium]|jgi:replication factor C small subunit|nr:AAA family ATPase [bacterium]